MKKKMLIIGIVMEPGGTEHAFLSFARRIDYETYDVELLLASKEGELMRRIPPQIKVSAMGELGEIFKITKNNAFSVISRLFLRKNPFFAVRFLPEMLKMTLGGVSRAYAADRIWLKLMKEMPELEEKYDVALAFWGDHTMFYMVDKVKADKKISWLHFDYDEPPREDAVYLPYFEKCDKIFTVSHETENSLKNRFPSLGEKLETLENYINENEILERAKEPCDYRDGFSGRAILSVGRLCDQKGFDLAIPAVARLCREGKSLHYYIVGGGGPEYEEKLRTLISKEEAEKWVTILPRTENPYKFMARCDVYLQPSRYEGKPIAVEEAKILKCPLCVTNYRSAREQTKGVTNAVVCEISEDGIYGGLENILRNI